MHSQSQPLLPPLPLLLPIRFPWNYEITETEQLKYGISQQSGTFHQRITRAYLLLYYVYDCFSSMISFASLKSPSFYLFASLPMTDCTGRQRGSHFIHNQKIRVTATQKYVILLYSSTK